VAGKSLTRDQNTDLAPSLQALLDIIRRAETTASTGMTYRLEGAVTAFVTVTAAVLIVGSLDLHYFAPPRQPSLLRLFGFTGA
jgi:hypothetical protein